MLPFVILLLLLLLARAVFAIVRVWRAVPRRNADFGVLL
jgi:hypothetical protein